MLFSNTGRVQVCIKEKSIHMITIEQHHINRIHELLDLGLVKGGGPPEPGKMCVEQVINYALDLPHSDTIPNCVSEFFNKQKIKLNDCSWSSPKTRAEGMRKIAIAQLGSVAINNEVAKETFRKNLNKYCLPYLIKKHLEQSPNDKRLLVASKEEPTEELRQKLHVYNYYNYYNYNYYYYFGDEWLLLIAEVILVTLQELNSPGCKWL